MKKTIEVCDYCEKEKELFSYIEKLLCNDCIQIYNKIIDEVKKDVMISIEKVADDNKN